MGIVDGVLERALANDPDETWEEIEAMAPEQFYDNLWD